MGASLVSPKFPGPVSNYCYIHQFNSEGGLLVKTSPAANSRQLSHAPISRFRPWDLNGFVVHIQSFHDPGAKRDTQTRTMLSSRAYLRSQFLDDRSAIKDSVVAPPCD